MSGLFCGCGVSGLNPNTGKPNFDGIKATDRIILVQQRDSQGNANTVLASDFVDGVLPAEFVLQKLYNADISKRWFLLPSFDADNGTKADPDVQSVTGSNDRIITDGIRSYDALHYGLSPTYARQIEKLACKEMAYFKVDICGSLVGSVLESTPTIMSPIKIADRTMYAKYEPANTSATSDSQMMIRFQELRSENDANLKPITAEFLGESLLSADAMINVLVSVSDILATGFNATLRLEYNSFGSDVSVAIATGWVASDFALVDSSGTPVTIATAVEVGATGVYAIAFASTPAETLTLTGALSLVAGLEESYVKERLELQSTSITTP